ncbi:MAG: DHHA1 domain-containing protein, partial [Candidatus Saccharibacteria bacterium]|nr:DHHA1 domain-containing protein [Candidatus Saccharibacteria bacterium]
DRVLVVSSPGWNHGVIGIVASKLVEKYKKPVFIIGERGDEATGSARSFGDFSAADAVRVADDIILRGGGHGAAAGVTLEPQNIPAFRQRVNEFYDSLQLTAQERYLLPRADVEIADFSQVDEQLVADIARMEPFGNGNPEPVLKIARATVLSVRRMGADGQHVKLALRDADGRVLQVLAFNAPEEFFREPGDEVAAWFQPTLNEWQGVRTVEGRLLHLELVGG